MADSDKDQGKNRRLGVENWGWSSVGRILGGRTIRRSGDVVCGLHHAEGGEERGFLSLASKQGRWFLPVWPQNHSLGFPDLDIKTDSRSLVI
jgi:hypothetical protein